MGSHAQSVMRAGGTQRCIGATTFRSVAAGASRSARGSSHTGRSRFPSARRRRTRSAHSTHSHCTRTLCGSGKEGGGAITATGEGATSAAKGGTQTARAWLF